jgi:hypothetical protein
MENIEAQQINAWLATLERVPLRDDPMFRLVWSNDQRELRKCTQRLFLGKTFIKEVTHTERVLKYPWLKDRWVFEMWFSPEVVLHDELPETNQGSYEPLYVFEGSKGDSLPLRKDVVEFLVARIRKPKSSSALIQSVIAQDLEDKEKKQDQFDKDYLDVSTDIQSNLHFGEAVIVPPNYPTLPPNLRGKIQ